METYGERRQQYRRRVRMAVWVALGIAGEVAFIAAGALVGAPNVFKAVVLSLVMAAGATLAFARVGFEWQATRLQRRIARGDVLSNSPLAPLDRDWPTFPETCWSVCRGLIALGWIVLFAGVWYAWYLECGRS